MSGIAIVIATKGRPTVVAETIASLSLQSLQPGQIVVSVTNRDEDLPASLTEDSVLKIVSGPPGLTLQRNRAVDSLADDISVVAFIDDDVELHRDYVQRMWDLFSAHPDLAVAGAEIIADGNIDRLAGRKLLDESKPAPPELIDGEWAYGCGMTGRRSVFRSIRFDERLPLYALYEDFDWSSRCRAVGRVCVARGCTLVHLKVASGRVSRRKFGFSQVMNSYYLWRKGSIAGFREVFIRHWVRGVGSSVCRSFLLNERGAGARQQLAGQITAFLFLLRGRIEPEYILNMR